VNERARALWDRAGKAIAVAKRDLSLCPDAAASRAYYAAFYAVSALFALDDKSFTKHSAVEAGVHRELVRAGKWPPDAGAAYSRLFHRRSRADYGAERHVSAEGAEDSIAGAERILRLVAETSGGALHMEDSEEPRS
jgi:uncharacterized protein (UPF0332 family)